MDLKGSGVSGADAMVRTTLHRMLNLVLQVGSLTMTSMSGEGLRNLALGVADVVALAGTPPSSRVYGLRLKDVGCELHGFKHTTLRCGACGRTC